MWRKVSSFLVERARRLRKLEESREDEGSVEGS
jgi:hypothetical protein